MSPGGDSTPDASALHARLARLRREPVLRPPDPERPEAERSEAPALPAWLGRRLERRQAGAGDHGFAGTSGTPAADAGLRAVGPPRDLVEERNERGTFGVRALHLPVDSAHGDWTLEEARGVDPAELARLAKDPALAELSLERAVFLDIETTGLSGGAGTVPFQVGLGWFEPSEQGAPRFVLWQGFLRGPEEEPAMLEAVAERVRASSGIVSFFGKSFDRHRLEDKMRMHGVAPPFADRAHLDLYHPLRRLYRAALPDGKLQTQERALCGVEREDDLPGSFAPAAWFDFLAGRAHRLEDVFRHNADDVLSLVVLAAHLGHTLGERRRDGRTLTGCPRARAAGLTKLFDAPGCRRLALPWLERCEAERGQATDEAFTRLAARIRRGAAREARSAAQAKS